jgi:hypothetical protein
MRALPLLSLVGLTACRPDAASGDTTAPCTVTEVSASWPEDGLSPTTRWAAVSLWFSGEADLDQVALNLWGDDGESVEGALELIDGGLRFQPTEWLAEDATYTWDADVCGAVAGGSFTTGSEGQSADPAALVDTTWGLDLSRAEWLQPAGGESLFGSLFSGLILLGVEAADDSSIDLLSAVGEEVEADWWQQDPCFATADFEPVSFLNNPYVDAGPVDMTFVVQGIDAILHDVVITGAVADEGAALADGGLVAEFDARDYGALGSASDVCGYVEQFTGVSCSACASDGEESCVPLEVAEIDGERIDGLALAPNPNPQECK